MANKKRFTFFTEDYPAVTCDSCYEDQNEYYTGPAIYRLAEYEGTGLMPADVAALIQELKRAKQQCREERRWIPVTERLPDCDGRYFCNVKSFAFPGSFYQTILEYNQYGFKEGRIYTDAVTHWMPLPEPPKEGTP